MKTPAFLTGSRAYGESEENSDLDLVVRVSEEVHEKLQTMAETKDSIWFGKLNLICCTSDKEYLAWKRATEEMVNSEEVYTKQQAIRVLDRTHYELGISFLRKSGTKE